MGGVLPLVTAPEPAGGVPYAVVVQYLLLVVADDGGGDSPLQADQVLVAGRQCAGSDQDGA